MSDDLKALLTQRAELEARIQAAAKQGRINALLQIRQIAADFQLTAEDITRAVSGRVPKTPAAAKYRDPDSGMTWTGAGKRPRWLVAALAAGTKLESFAIDAPAKAPTKKVPAKKTAKK